MKEVKLVITKDSISVEVDGKIERVFYITDKDAYLNTLRKITKE